MNFHFIYKSDCGFVVHYPIDKKVYVIHRLLQKEALRPQSSPEQQGLTLT